MMRSQPLQKDDVVVYVEVLHFGGGSLAPVRAAQKHGVCFELLEETEDDEHYPWEFTKGQVVACRMVEFSAGENHWQAVRVCDHLG